MGIPTSLGRGQIWLVDLGLAQKVRPVVVLSVGFLDNERALVTYVPRTTSLRGTRFEVSHSGHGFAKGGFDAQSMGTVPVVKLVRRLAELDADTLEEVENAVCAWLGL